MDTDTTFDANAEAQRERKKQNRLRHRRGLTEKVYVSKRTLRLAQLLGNERLPPMWNLIGGLDIDELSFSSDVNGTVDDLAELGAQVLMATLREADDDELMSETDGYEDEERAAMRAGLRALRVELFGKEAVEQEETERLNEVA
jgi:hypothetical protein